jgi:hypothetical protein
MSHKKIYLSRSHGECGTIDVYFVDEKEFLFELHNYKGVQMFNLNNNNQRCLWLPGKKTGRNMEFLDISYEGEMIGESILLKIDSPFVSVTGDFSVAVNNTNY